MKTRSLLLLGCVTFVALFSLRMSAAILTFSPGTVYELQSGSQLLRDCPICDSIPRPIPMTGTFRLVSEEDSPLFPLFEIRDIDFLAKSDLGFYTVTGNGSYEIGGEVALAQNALISMDILSPLDDITCIATNSNELAPAAWPNIQLLLIQTNGTDYLTYELTLVATPKAMQITKMEIDTTSGNITLQWTTSGKVQLERAEAVSGPYTVISPITSDVTFTDIAAYDAQKTCYYRLRQN